MDIEQYIESGIVCAYLLGLATEAEKAEFERMLLQYPELQAARRDFERGIEELAISNVVVPPKSVRENIIRRLKERPPKKIQAEKNERQSRWRNLIGAIRSFFLQPPPPPPTAPPAALEEPDPDDNGGSPDKKKFRNLPLLIKVLKNPAIISRLHWRRFEELMTDMTNQLGFMAKITPGIKDGGKDIIVLHHTEFGKFVYYIECKHRTKGRKIDVSEVRALYGIISKEDVTAGLLITNTGFTRGAIDFANGIPNRIKLIDQQMILQWIDRINQRGLIF